MSDLISRQDAIDAFRKATADGDKVDFCVSVINDLPSAEHHKLNIAEYIHDQYPDVWRHAEKELEVPSAERTGEWIRTGADGYCSLCQCDMPIFREDEDLKFCETDFCPNCGARMVSE